MLSPLLEQLIHALRCLPGVGPKSAQRMALHLLERNRDGAQHLAATLGVALDNIGHCQSCRVLSEEDICPLCSDSKRDDSLLCIVGSPADMLAIEQAGSFRGRYFILAGQLSPIDGMGPDEVGIPELMAQLEKRPVREVILANNPTVEGEATAYYIANLLRERDIEVSRIAHGVPMGGELEYVDGSTLSHAFSGRQKLRY